MKRLFNTLMIMAAVSLGVASCDIEKKFDTTIPQYPLTQLVKSATATVGDETVEGVVDNAAHTVTFVFNDTKDFTSTEIKFNFPSRVILKEGAVEELTADLNAGKTYTFVVNNLEEDITYTVTAYKASIVQVDRTQCSVITGLDGDADPSKLEKAASNNGYGTGCAFLFDGKWMKKKDGYTDVHYQCFGWEMNSLKGSNGENFGTAYTVDFGAPMRVARMRFLPYRAYTESAAALYEIYAWILDGEPSGDWSNWQLIATVDDSAKWNIIKEVGEGETHPLITEGTTVDFVYSEVPLARYYRVKIVKNFYEYYQDKMNSAWAQRKYWYDVSELEAWRYNLDSEE